jgi:hypothetical protein
VARNSAAGSRARIITPDSGIDPADGIPREYESMRHEPAEVLLIVQFCVVMAVGTGDMRNGSRIYLGKMEGMQI